MLAQRVHPVDRSTRYEECGVDRLLVLQRDPVDRRDEQRRGPYSLWVHEHRFREADGDTFAEDYIRYAVPGGSLVHSLFVRRDVEKIFAFRKQKMRELFGAAPEQARDTKAA